MESISIALEPTRYSINSFDCDNCCPMLVRNSTDLKYSYFPQLRKVSWLWVLDQKSQKLCWRSWETGSNKIVHLDLFSKSIWIFSLGFFFNPLSFSPLFSLASSTSLHFSRQSTEYFHYYYYFRITCFFVRSEFILIIWPHSMFLITYQILVCSQNIMWSL